MRELAPVGGAASAAARAMEGAGDRAAARHPPTPAGARAGPAPAPPIAAPPAVEVARQGLLLEALAWRRGSAGEAGAPSGLRGEVRVLPLAAAGGEPDPAPPQAARGSRAAATWSAGARVATVLGPAGPDALLAETAEFTILLRGARLHLPQGARLRLSWERPPLPFDQPSATGGEPAAVRARASLALPPGAAAAAAAPADRPDEPHAGATPHASSSTGGSLELRAGEAMAGGARAAMAAAEAPPVAEAVWRFARALGLAVGEADERDRRPAARAEPETGGSQLAIDLPELGRIRLALAWTPRRVELAIDGLPDLPGAERAALLRAFEAALAAAGGQGRAVLLVRGDLASGRPPAAQPGGDR